MSIQSMKNSILALLLAGILYSCKKLDTYGSANSGLLAAPSNIELCTAYGEASIYWSDNSLNEDSFIIARSVDSINYIVIGTSLKNTPLFIDKSSDLDTGTKYYYSIIAANTTGKSDALTGSIVIRGSKSISDTLTVGTGLLYQIWKTRNLETSFYKNGDTIPHVVDPAIWSDLSTGAWCWYNNDSVNYAQFGKLYNWYAIADLRGIAPAGWHVATLNEWNILIKNLDPDADVSDQPGRPSLKVGAQLKEACFSHWSFPNNNATDTVHFRALPGHGRNENGLFDNSNYGVWWTANSAGSPTMAWGLSISDIETSIYKGYHNKKHAYSVRLVKD